MRDRGLLLSSLEPLSNSLWPLMMGLACCGLEMMSTAAVHYDLDRFGLIFRATPRQADVMIVSGTVTKKMGPLVRRLYEQMANPKLVIAIGVCATAGGPYVNSYSVGEGRRSNRSGGCVHSWLPTIAVCLDLRAEGALFATVMHTDGILNRKQKVISMKENNELEQMTEKIRNLLQTGNWASAKSNCIEALIRYPTSAQLWVFMGEALEQLNEPSAAWKAYDRGWLLDPQASWIDTVRTRLLRYRHGKIQPWLKKLLSVPPVTISAALVVKNEERIIGECIERLRPAVDEIVVVDTGSTDKTKDILRDMGIHTYDFEWNDDFGAARNYALTKVSGDWVLCVDADELLLQEDVECPRTVAGLLNNSNPPCICRVGILNKVGNRVLPLYDMSRFFPTRFGLRFWGRVHEQIGPPEGGLFAAAYPRPAVRIRFEHDGYQQEVMYSKSKFDRNIRLLRASIQDDPDDIVSWGFLGRELLYTGHIDEAIEALSHTEALTDRHPDYGMISVVRMLLINALLAKDRVEEAMDVANRVCESDPSFPDVWYTKGKVEMSLALKHLRSAQASFQTAINAIPKYRGILSFDPEIMQWKAVAALGDVAKMNGDLAEARRLYSQAKNCCPDSDVLEHQLKFIEDQRKSLNNS